MKPKVFVTQQIPSRGIDLLKKKGYSVKVRKEAGPMKKKDLIKELGAVDALLSLLTENIDADIMDAGLPRLKIISNYAVGFNNIDIDAAKERSLYVTNTPNDQISESVAEHTFAMIMALAKRLVEADSYTRAGKYKFWGPDLFLGMDLKGATLGIIGSGRIGMRVGEIAAHGYQMKVLYSDIKKNPSFEKATGARFVRKETLLKNSDFVSVHVPLFPSTRHLISTKELRLMKKTAFVVNTARGPIVDEIALTKALARKQIAGAALDVFECEPSIDCNPKDKLELRKMDNVILTPHIASASEETRQIMSEIAAKNIIDALSGRKPKHAIS